MSTNLTGMNRAAVRKAMHDMRSAPVQSRGDFVLHPTKGWRRMSVINSAAAILTADMKAGKLPWTCPPDIARETLRKARADAP